MEGKKRKIVHNPNVLHYSIPKNAIHTTKIKS